MPLHAVITGDLINSTDLQEPERRRVLTVLHQLMDELAHKGEGRYTLFRGDSIQGVLEDPLPALRHALHLKSGLMAIRFSDKQRSPSVDIRLSIGLGSIDFARPSIVESDGEAFRLSGRAIDRMKSSGRELTLNSSQEKLNEEWEVILLLLENVTAKWTVASAEVVRELLKEDKEQWAGERLGISQPAVNMRKKHAGWEAIRATLHRFETHTIPSLQNP